MDLAADEIVNALWLLVYNLFIIFFVSRKVYERFGTYMARKTIHFLSAGVSIILAPLVFKEAYLPVLLAGLMILLTLTGHFWRLYGWFQVKGNYADVYFNVMCTLLLALFWNYNVWIGVLSCLFMAWGDGITGIVRNIIYKRRTKGIWGNVAMFPVCALLGYFILGYVGVVGGIFSCIVEKLEIIDDNISIPLGSAVLMTMLRLLQY